MSIHLLSFSKSRSVKHWFQFSTTSSWPKSPVATALASLKHVSFKTSRADQFIGSLSHCLWRDVTHLLWFETDFFHQRDPLVLCKPHAVWRFSFTLLQVPVKHLGFLKMKNNGGQSCVLFTCIAYNYLRNIPPNPRTQGCWFVSTRIIYSIF